MTEDRPASLWCRGAWLDHSVYPASYLAPGVVRRLYDRVAVLTKQLFSAPFISSAIEAGALYERAQSRNRLADDQRVHLPGTLVGVDRFGIGHEPTDMIFEQDAVAAEQFTRIADGFAAFDGAERLGERCVFVTHHAFVLKLRETQHHRLGRCDISKHAHQQILYELEAPDRPAELLPLGRITQRVLVGAHLAADGEPGHPGAGHP